MCDTGDPCDGKLKETGERFFQAGTNERFLAPPGHECYTTYQGPAKIGVVYTDPNDPDATPGSIQLQFFAIHNGDGICKLLDTIGIALSGLIPEVGGPVAATFILAGTGCS